MDIGEIERALVAHALKIEDSDVNAEGRMVHLVSLEGGHAVAMFHADAVDLVAGKVSLSGIVARNKEADLCEPWPIRRRRRRSLA